MHATYLDAVRKAIFSNMLNGLLETLVSSAISANIWLLVERVGGEKSDKKWFYNRKTVYTFVLPFWWIISKKRNISCRMNIRTALYSGSLTIANSLYSRRQQERQ